MANTPEMLVSARDAEVLAALVGEGRRMSAIEAEAANALADTLLEAELVAHERFPEDRVAMNSTVVYRVEPAGEPRTVVLVHPSVAAPGEGRVSVLSPVGRALLGRRRGALSSIDVPGGRARTIRVLEV